MTVVTIKKINRKTSVSKKRLRKAIDEVVAIQGKPKSVIVNAAYVSSSGKISKIKNR